MNRPLPDCQNEVVTRMRAGEELIGPVRVTHGRGPVIRSWGFRGGNAVSFDTVQALRRRGLIDVLAVDYGNARRAELTAAGKAAMAGGR